MESSIAIAEKIKKLSDFNSTSANDLLLHFQILISARESKIFMEAPGLYFPDIGLYVISKSGLSRGHATLYQTIIDVIPEDKRRCYAFVLYPGSLIRLCFDTVLRKTAKIIAKDLRISMENVFNRKHHPQKDLVDSEIEKELIKLLRNDIK